MPIKHKFDFDLSKIYDVVIIGEILVDIITDDDFNKSYQLYGGSSANIALNLRQLGIHSKLYGSVGNDTFGSFLLDNLNNHQINYNVNIVQKPTSFVKVNKNALSPTPSFHRSADYFIPFTSELEQDLAQTKILHFSFWPLSNEPSRSTLLKSIQIAKEHHALIGFDPNYHSMLDDSIQSNLTLLKDICQYVDIIKPSFDDSKRIFGDCFSIDQLLTKYQKLGCKLIIMTLGEKGLIAKYKDSIISFPTYATEILDSTGAGDAFWSGLYGGLCQGESIENAISYGLQCSALNLKVIGANANLPEINQIKSMVESR
ncbi:MAG: carbohydrate kinase [Firmicutes bacterium]|nr:carbohydrate kinase [Bacillota bacterium]